MSKLPKFANLCLTILLAAVLLVGLGFAMRQVVQATTTDESYPVQQDGVDAPLGGRAAPYGQFIVMHNSQTVTTVLRMGTVARSNGYAALKGIMCDVGGTGVLTGTLYARVTSTGDIYTLTVPSFQFPVGATTAVSVTQIAPWMSLGLESTATGTTATCGLYVYTP